MNSATTQLRVTLPAQLQEHLQAKAEKLGLSMSSYVKNLIINDIKEIEEYPTYYPSAMVRDAYRKAKKEEKEGKIKIVEELDEFLQDL